LSLRSVTYHTLHRVRIRSATYKPLGELLGDIVT
jgi:hypothetical protein